MSLKLSKTTKIGEEKMVKNDPQKKTPHESNHFNISRHQHHARSKCIILRIMCVAISRHQHHAHSNGNILRIVCVALLLCVDENMCFGCGRKLVFPDVEN